MLSLKINSNIVLYAIIALLTFLLFMEGCGEDPEPQIIEVEVPAVSGDFEPEKPVHEEGKDTTIVKWKDKIVKVPNPINDSLAIAYQELSDSLDATETELERYKMYLNAIQIRDFESHFEDDYLDLTISGKVQGEVKSIKPEYTIKEREAETTITPKQTALRVLGGFEVGNNTLFDDIWFKANLGLQNAKGDIWTVGWAKNNGKDYYFLGYDFSIWNIKK